MSQLQDYFKACRASPQEAAGWAVLADYLLEQGSADGYEIVQQIIMDIQAGLPVDPENNWCILFLAGVCTESGNRIEDQIERALWAIEHELYVPSTLLRSLAGFSLPPEEKRLPDVKVPKSSVSE